MRLSKLVSLRRAPRAESGQKIVVIRQLSWQHLNGRLAVKFRIMGQVNAGHASLTKETNESLQAYLFSHACLIAMRLAQNTRPLEQL